jgi:hypothetical protein
MEGSGSGARIDDGEARLQQIESRGGRSCAEASTLVPEVSTPAEKRGGKEERGGGGCRPSTVAAAHRGKGGRG